MEGRRPVAARATLRPGTSQGDLIGSEDLGRVGVGSAPRHGPMRVEDTGNHSAGSMQLLGWRLGSDARCHPDQRCGEECRQLAEISGFFELP